MIKELKGKNIAIVAMGKSQLDYHMSISHSKEYDEVWAINSMCAVIKCDRVFMMDPASRFFDTFDAGPQTQVMRRTLPKLEIPVYSCELDSRVPAIELFPLDELVEKMGCGYLNNTIAYAIAFAAFNEVGKVSMYGADFSYSTNIHFGELGRGCCEFWLAKLYGYHRLEDPPVVYLKGGDLKTTNFSNIEENNEKLVGVSGRQDPIRVSKTNGLTPPEPNQY